MVVAQIENRTLLAISAAGFDIERSGFMSLCGDQLRQIFVHRMIYLWYCLHDVLSMMMKGGFRAWQNKEVEK